MGFSGLFNALRKEVFWGFRGLHILLDELRKKSGGFQASNFHEITGDPQDVLDLQYLYIRANLLKRALGVL